MSKKECCRCCCEPKISFDGLSSQVINDIPETEEEHTAVLYGFLEQTNDFSGWRTSKRQRR